MRSAAICRTGAVVIVASLFAQPQEDVQFARFVCFGRCAGQKLRHLAAETTLYIAEFHPSRSGLLRKNSWIYLTYKVFIYLFSFLKRHQPVTPQTEPVGAFQLGSKRTQLSYRATFGSINLLRKKVILFHIAPPRLDRPRQTRNAGDERELGGEKKKQRRKRKRKRGDSSVSLPVSHLLPLNPCWQTQLLGETQVPPFWHKPSHMAGGEESGGLAALLLSQINEH